MSPIEETALYLRRWLEDKGGSVERGALEEFYARFPLHASFARDNLPSFLASFPHFFTSTANTIALRQDAGPEILTEYSGTAVMAVASFVAPVSISATDLQIAQTLEAFVRTRGGEIVVSPELPKFYSQNPGIMFPKSFKSFVQKFPDRFVLSSNCAKLTLKDPTTQTVTVNTVTGCQDAGPEVTTVYSGTAVTAVVANAVTPVSISATDLKIAQKLEAFVRTRGGEIVVSPELPKFYSQNPGIMFTKSFKSFVQKFPDRFVLSSNCAKLTLKAPGPPYDIMPVSESVALGNNLEAFLLGQQSRSIHAGSIGEFYKRHPGSKFKGGLKKWIEGTNGRFQFRNDVITLRGTQRSTTSVQQGSSTSANRGGSTPQPTQQFHNGNLHVGRQSSAQPSSGQGSSQPASGTTQPSLGVDAKLPVLKHRKLYEQDRGGVHVLPDPKRVSSSGFIPLVPVDFHICNRSDVTHSVVKIKITNAKYGSRMKKMEIVNEANVINFPIRPATDMALNLRWKSGVQISRRVKLCVTRVEFVFQAGFSISRFIALDAGGAGASARALERARAASEYFRPTPNAHKVRFHVNSDELGPRTALASQPLRVRLPRIQLIRNVDTRILYEPVLLRPNYGIHFSTLLHRAFEFECKELEDHDIVNEMPTRWQLGPRNEILFMFKGKALGEKRPSVLEYDKAWCQRSGTVFGGLRGVVRRVTVDEVGIEFTRRLELSQRYDIRFEPTDFNFNMQHEALLRTVTSQEKLSRVFSPAAGDEVTLSTPAGYAPQLLPPFFSRRYGYESHDLGSLITYRKLNDEQRAAVRVIVNYMPQTRISPFLLFGPPGTGKTTTLVAAVVCLLKFKPESRILVSASSNSACEVFYDKLRNEPLFTAPVARLLASSRAKAPQPISELIHAKVIISTCITSGKLSALPGNALTHVFLDEAGQSTEIESLIPLIMASMPSTQLILGGDHKQLGPVVRDNFLVTVGRMDISLFERLMRRPKYSTLDELYAVMLTLNYRAHADLLRVPSRLFYGGRLVPHDMWQKKQLTGWSWSFAGGANSPLVVHHVDGKEDRERTCPSWFNLAECGRVMDCIRALRQENLSSRLNVERDVIVIAPYVAQVRKLRIFLEEEGLSGVKVGSVESFQGSESRIVIVSTCRSSSMNGDYDAVHHVGFLKNEKRFNVAITRAMEMLIVVGNVHVLRTDYHWKELIQQAESDGSLVMDDADEDESDGEEPEL